VNGRLSRVDLVRCQLPSPVHPNRITPAHASVRRGAGTSRGPARPGGHPPGRDECPARPGHPRVGPPMAWAWNRPVLSRC